MSAEGRGKNQNLDQNGRENTKSSGFLLHKSMHQLISVPPDTAKCEAFFFNQNKNETPNRIVRLLMVITPYSAVDKNFFTKNETDQPLKNDHLVSFLVFNPAFV